MENAGIAPPATRPSALLEIARQAPPMPSAVLLMTSDANDFRAFTDLVNTYVPEAADEILEHKDPSKQIQEFAGWFATAHFPLCEYAIDYLEEMEMNRSEMDHSVWGHFMDKVPVELNAIEYEELHELWERYDAPITHLALLTGWSEMYNEGVLASWIETALAASVPPETIERIPEGGIHPAILREALAGTQEEDALHVIEWLLRVTGNMFMDHSDEEFQEGMIQIDWSEESIAFLTTEWKESQEILKAISRTVNRMKDDPVAGLNQVLDFMFTRMECIDTESVINKWNSEHSPSWAEVEDNQEGDNQEGDNQEGDNQEGDNDDEQ